MPKRSDHDKKQELDTYRKLRLTRESKSKKRRERAEDSHLYMFVGGRSLDRPYLKVLRRDYEEIWNKIANKILKEIPSNTSDQAIDLYRTRIEREIYDTLSTRHSVMIDLDAQFLKKNGRRMTPHERSLFAATEAVDTSPTIPNPATRANSRRRFLIHDLVQKIEANQQHQPRTLQQAWAEAVGEEAAQESILEKVDTQAGLAICRCLSSTLSFKIRRMKDLPQKLAKILGMNIRKIVFR